ncbi:MULTISPECIES: cytochrome P450 family protein [Bacillus]|uniref:Cytochrome P450 n=5 Tax=Bacillus thuringiensis TaxID=1428 RepID=A0A9X7BI03_BACTU|nr:MULTISPECIES: cytochrome P450 [Bacillus]AEA16288.1 cytochrome P450 [Bacillus thuringiensis serovar chinensis CT-43]AFV18420.1 cytochrome P450 [Bacillus thuringiensis Bt407]AGG01367.1 putative cytochrome P450 hydroxylase [Bacillus thuringiensis serovar thuringiensis str. IS5056]AHA72060.1 cytochrome P450 [Bacillus thuringiensis YBT-1518]ARP57983.1 cytochrome P450 [Bacillus thuringiensis]
MSMKNKVGLSIEDGINLASAQFKEDAYEIYKESRKKQPILFVNQVEIGKEWLITRYEDALPLLKDNRLKKDWTNVFSQDIKNMYLSVDNSDHLTTHMLNSDPPNHSRLRSLVQKAFTPKMIAQLDGRIERIADDLISDIERKGTLNLVDDYSFPLPIIVISEMLGIPKEDQAKFRIWSHAVIASPETPEEIKETEKQLSEFITYLQYLVDIKRKEPKEDLVSALILAESEGHKLSARELYSMIMLLIVAGHETTVNLITNTVLALLENPNQLQLLKDNPKLIDSAIEEGLRYYSPVEVTTARWAAEPFQIHHQTIQKGDMVIIALASANRDETVFENPEIFDITRENNRHIAFGHGSHFCLGAPLARLEAKIAITTLFNRMPELKIKGNREEIKWQGNYLMRSLEELPLTF